MSRRVRACAVLIAALASTRLSIAVVGQSSDARVVADIGAGQILVSDLVAGVNEARRQGLAQNRVDSFGSAATRRALDELLDVRRLADAAREQKLTERPEIKREIDRLVDEFLARQMVKTLTAAHSPDESAVREYYQAHQRDFELPRRVRARHIVVKTEADAVALAGKLKRNADFGELATAGNIDATKAKGGELGWVSRGTMVGPFDKTLFGLRVGEISPIVRTPYGFHIIQVEEIEAAKPQPLESIAPEIRSRLVQAQIDALKADLAKAHPARIHEDVLKSVR
jgi:parvulin-like peptidyl-prolyl isomerase